VLLNLLSVGAAYGLITLIFQDGRLQGLLGYTSVGAIIWWVPLFMFAKRVFGLVRDRQTRYRWPPAADRGQSSPENRSQADCLDTPSAAPMRVQLTPRARRIST
jgi:hypothetical protein